MGGEAAVRAAFRAQAEWCGRLGSPFTARLCEAFAQNLDRSTPLGRRLLDWPGEPDARHDSVPLRIAGGLHACVRRGHAPALARLYPPAPLPDATLLWAAVQGLLAERTAELGRWLDGPPQTNEVARSAVLFAGCGTAAAATGLPLSLLELGASAGLNLNLDRYAYRLGGFEGGDPASPVRLAPAWTGPDPALAPVQVVARRGVDVAPLDVRSAADRERLIAYTWPDQAERRARTEAALALASAAPPRLDRADAADWLEARLAEPPPPGTARVVLHSIAFQYFPAETRGRIAAAMAAAGACSTPDEPLAWLRFEIDPGEGGRPSLRLRLWPGETDRLLASADAHVRAVTWLG